MKIVGHTDVRERLRRMKDRLPPSLLFAGPEGIGKKLAALEFARELTGETRALDLTQPISQTESLFFVSPDGASIKIEQVRDAIHFLSLARDGKPLVLIFDQAQLIGPQAANALLKSVEEPPAGVHFFFLTPSPSLMLSTLRSRSQVVRFAPLSNEDVRTALCAAQPELKPEAWAIEMSGGSPGAALELLRGGDEAMDVRPAVSGLIAACGPEADGPERSHALHVLRETLKDRELQAIALRFLVRSLNQAWRERVSLESGREKVKTSSWLSSLSFEKLELATDLALDAEADLSRNVDRQLLWEAFASRLSHLTSSRVL